jgi:hypothetical protein
LTIGCGTNGTLNAHLNRDGGVRGTHKNFRIDHPADPARHLVHGRWRGPSTA